MTLVTGMAFGVLAQQGDSGNRPAQPTATVTEAQKAGSRSSTAAT